jgi:putative endonuclease
MVFYVYIVTNKRNGTFYIGHTDDLAKRVWQHKAKTADGFTKKYGCDRLVWFCEFPSRDEAKARERQMKAWRRAWKIEEIEKLNAGWLDLSLDFGRVWPWTPALPEDTVAESKP